MPNDLAEVVFALAGGVENARAMSEGVVKEVYQAVSMERIVYIREILMVSKLLNVV